MAGRAAQSDLGQSDLGQSDLGQSDPGQSDEVGHLLGDRHLYPVFRISTWTP